MSEESTTGCVVHSKPAEARHGLLCTAHFDRLADMLREIEEQAALLSTTPSMAVRTGSAGGSLASQRSPARLDAIVARDPRRGDIYANVNFDEWGMDETLSVLETLHSICRQVREERRLTAPSTVTITGERDFLTRQLPWLAEQPYIDETYDILRSLLHQLRSTNGHRPDRPLTRCVLPTVHGLCGGDVWEQEVEQVVDLNGSRWRMSVPGGPAICGSCGASWVTDADKARLKLMIEQEHAERTRPRTEDGRQMVTAAELQVRLQLKPGAFRQRVHRLGIVSIDGYYDPDQFEDKATA